MKKRSLKVTLVVLVLCLALSGGIGVPTSIPIGSISWPAVVTAEAKPNMSKEFKKAMDEYLKFYKKYCKFMKRYKKGGNVTSMLEDYSNLLKQQPKMDKAFKKWKKRTLNQTELAYYLKINKQVLKLLTNM